MTYEECKRLAEDDGADGQLDAQGKLLNHRNDMFDEVLAAADELFRLAPKIEATGDLDELDLELVADILERAREIQP